MIIRLFVTTILLTLPPSLAKSEVPDGLRPQAENILAAYNKLIAVRRTLSDIAIAKLKQEVASARAKFPDIQDTEILDDRGVMNGLASTRTLPAQDPRRARALAVATLNGERKFYDKVEKSQDPSVAQAALEQTSFQYQTISCFGEVFFWPERKCLHDRANITEFFYFYLPMTNEMNREQLFEADSGYVSAKLSYLEGARNARATDQAQSQAKIQAQVLATPIDLTGITLGMKAERVVEMLQKYNSRLIFETFGLDLKRYRYEVAYLAAETPEWFAARTADKKRAEEARRLAAVEPTLDQEGYLITFSAENGGAIAILRQYRPGPARPLVVDVASKAVQDRYRFLGINGASDPYRQFANGTVLLGGPRTAVLGCSDQRLYVVPSGNLSRNFKSGGFDPNWIETPEQFGQVADEHLQNRMNTVSGGHQGEVEKLWVEKNCSPVLAVSIAPQKDDQNMVDLMVMHLYDIRSIISNLRYIQQQINKVQGDYVKSQKSNKPPL